MKRARRKHQKSRKGCEQCKQRHVKCDESRPICMMCNRLELPCMYPEQSSVNNAANMTTVRTPSSSLSSPSPHLVPTPDSSTWSITCMELMHHYSTCGCLCFAHHTPRHKLWVTDVPTISFSNSYVLHQILAVAALHCYIEHPQRTYLSDFAASHHHLALSEVQPVITNPSTNDSIPLFAFAGLTAIYAFGELATRHNRETPASDPIGDVVSRLRLTRGIGTIVSSVRHDILNSWASQMIALSSDAELAVLRKTGSRLEQMGVLDSIITVNANSDDIIAYRDAARRCLEYIQLLLAHPNQDDEIYHVIMAWPNQLDARYIELLERREPIALLVLAHYAVLLSMRPKLWWLRKWPLEILQHVTEFFDHDQQEWLEWPRMMLDELSKASLG